MLQHVNYMLKRRNVFKKLFQFLGLMAAIMLLLLPKTNIAQNSWEVVGTKFAGKSKDFSLTFSSSGTPYLAYANDATNGSITVRKFEGGQWKIVGQGQVSSGNGGEPSIAFPPSSNKPYVAYQDHSIGDKLVVEKFNGNKWVTIGEDSLSKNEAREICLKFSNVSGAPYVSYIDFTYDQFGSLKTSHIVKKFNGNIWNMVGNKLSSNDEVYEPTLIFPPSSDTPFIKTYYYDIDNDAKLSLKKFNGNDWVHVGLDATDWNGFEEVAKDPSSKAIYGAGNTYLMKYENNKWDTITNMKQNWGNLRLSPSTHTPFVAYKLGPNDEVTVERFNGNNWNTVGDKKISDSGPEYFALEFKTSSNTPFLVYSDNLGGVGITVKKYEGSFTYIEEETENNNITVFPNPAANKIKIDLSLEYNIDKYTLHTITGQKAKSGKITGKGTYTLSISDLSPGVYLLEVKGEEAVRTKKVVIE